MFLMRVLPHNNAFFVLLISAVFLAYLSFLDFVLGGKDLSVKYITVNNPLFLKSHTLQNGKKR
jgi:hypothetical protein